MYCYNVTMVNGKEYLIRTTYKNASDLLNFMFKNSRNTLSSWEVSRKDANECRLVTINGNHVVSVEVVDDRVVFTNEG